MTDALSYLNDLAARCAARAPRSKELAAASRGTLTTPALRGRFRFPLKEALFRIVSARADGAQLWDIDGNEYVDMLMGFGVYLFGHNPKFVVDAIRSQLATGIHFGTQDSASTSVAAGLCEMTGCERVFFCNSGTEAVMSALRLARAATGRSKFALFRGSYHGYGDATVAAMRVPGIPESARNDVIALDYGTPESLASLSESSADIAAVLVEPVQRARVGFHPREYLLELRELTTKLGIVLVFDEILTGFRIAPGGAQEYFGVRADLTTYGKILGGGLPIGVVAGKGDLLDLVDGGRWAYGDHSVPTVVPTFLAGTFSKHPLAMAAASAVLARLRSEGPTLQQTLNDRGRMLCDLGNDRLEQAAVPYRYVSFGSLIALEAVTPVSPAPIPGPPITPLDLLHYELLTRGFYCAHDGAFVISVAHDRQHCESFVEATVSSFLDMRASHVSV
jgi:glutamate-1-semialdehyde 2,1-aminomutase